MVPNGILSFFFFDKYLLSDGYSAGDAVVNNTYTYSLAFMEHIGKGTALDNYLHT